MTHDEIIQSIKGFMKNIEGTADTFYVGISRSPRERLSKGHNVDLSIETWAIFPASSYQTARSVEAYFVNEMKTGGGPDGGDETADFVYAFKKNRHTRPSL